MALLISYSDNINYQLFQTMRKNKQFVSFLNFDSKTSYKFTKVKTKRLIDDIRDHSEKLLTSSFVKEHLSELQTPLFEYTIEDSYKKWT